MTTKYIPKLPSRYDSLPGEVSGDRATDAMAFFCDLPAEAYRQVDDQLLSIDVGPFEPPRLALP